MHSHEIHLYLLCFCLLSLTSAGVCSTGRFFFSRDSFSPIFPNGERAGITYVTRPYPSSTRSVPAVPTTEETVVVTTINASLTGSPRLTGPTIDRAANTLYFIDSNTKQLKVTILFEIPDTFILCCQLSSYARVLIFHVQKINYANGQSLPTVVYSATGTEMDGMDSTQKCAIMTFCNRTNTVYWISRSSLVWNLMRYTVISSFFVFLF